jgi:hypothetical protein
LWWTGRPDGRAKRTNSPIENIKKRQNVQNSVPLNVPAMTNANGDVVEFNAAGVYLDMQAKGL